LPGPGPLESRLIAIRARVKRERAPRYQRSLFDRRVDTDAARRQAIADRIDAALCRTLRRVSAPIDNAATRIDLIAVWPERHR
jgi:hypothetical protein